MRHPTVDAPAAASSSLGSPPAIEVVELTRRFGGFTAVDGITFDVRPGEIFGFLGPNGAGKSTTISILCTLLPLTGGAARVQGHDVSTDSAAVRREIGVVFQDSTLDERLTARENLSFHADIYGVPRTLARQRAVDLLSRVGLDDRADTPVLSFSGGMRRRLEIARGLMHHPAVLFLDEPTVGLDPQTRRSLWSYVRSLRDAEGTTIFLTTHYMDEAEVCDRVAIIDDGRLVALDTPARLKDALGGDVVALEGPTPESLAKEIDSIFGVASVVVDGRVEFNVDDGGTFLAGALPLLDGRIESVAVRKPTLEDVFVSLTGSQIRETEADEADRLRAMVQRGGRRGMGRRGR